MAISCFPCWTVHILRSNMLSSHMPGKKTQRKNKNNSMEYMDNKNIYFMINIIRN